MDRDRRLTGFLRGQTNEVDAPAGFELSSAWRVGGCLDGFGCKATLLTFYRWKEGTSRQARALRWAFGVRSKRHDSPIPPPKSTTMPAKHSLSACYLSFSEIRHHSSDASPLLRRQVDPKPLF